MSWRRVRSVIDDWQLRRAVASFEQHQRRFESRPPRAPERLSLAEYGELLAGCRRRRSSSCECLPNTSVETDPDRDLSFVEWPEESGGSAAWAEIAARIKALNADPSLVEELPGHPALPPNDLVLYRLLEPERERELQSMVAALERVLELLGRG